MNNIDSDSFEEGQIAAEKQIGSIDSIKIIGSKYTIR